MDTKAIKPEDNKGGTFTAQLTAEEVTSASITPVPAQAPGIIWAEPGTTKEEAIYYKTRDAEAGTIGGLTRDFTNLNGGTGQQHENSADWEVLQSSKIVENLIDIVTEGYIQEQNTIARVDDTSFTVAGNVSAIYNAGRTVRFNQDNAELVTVVSATYAAGTGLTTIVITDDTIPATLTTAEYSLQPKGVALAKLSKVLPLDNTTEFTPDADYEPSTKKYTDDLVIAVPNSLSRQAIINGNFDVWQRGTSVAVTGAATFLADRWSDASGADGGTLPTQTRSRQALTAGDIPNAFYYSRMAVNGAGSSLGVNSYGHYSQRIENGTRFLCGLNKTVTVSFWAKSDIANKKLGVTLQQGYGSGGSPSASEFILSDSVITLTSSWVKYTKTFTTNTLVGKTFGTDNNDSLRLLFYYMWGTTSGNNQVLASVAAETYVGSGNIDIAQVQLCAGDVALPFQPKSFEEELRACKRYYEKSFDYVTAPADNAGTNGAIIQKALITDPYTFIGQVFYEVEKRTAATPVLYNPLASAANKVRNVSDNTNIPGATQNRGTKSFHVYVNNSELTAGKQVVVHWSADSEL